MQWLIDGHNLIGQLPDLHLDDPHDEEKLLEILRRYRARTGDTLTVIFDAGLTYQPAKTQKRGGITVQFAPHKQTADQIIMRRLKKVKNPQAVMVVSSDRVVQQAAHFAGVRVISAQEFAQKLVWPTRSDHDDQNGQAEVRLSEDEVEAWLAIFNQRRT